MNKLIQALFSPNDTVHIRLIAPDGRAIKKAYKVQLIDYNFLKKINAQGFNVYAVINKGGDSDSEIEEYTACFFESDSLSIEEQKARIAKLPLKPSFTVQTKKSIHVYYVFAKPIKQKYAWLDRQLAFMEIFPDADKALKNPSRIMRLPGFTYHKPGVEPFTVSIDIEDNFPKFCLGHLQEVFPRKPKEIKSLDVEAIKRSERVFRQVVGNIPEQPKKSFQPFGLEGDSWMFYKDKSGYWYLHRWSGKGKAYLTIIDYVQEVKSLDEKGAFNYLIDNFPEFSDAKNSPTISPTAKPLEPQAKEAIVGESEKSEPISLNLIQEKLETFEVIDKDRELDLQKLIPSEIANLFEQIENARAFPKEHLLTMFLPVAASLCGKSKVVVKKGFEEGDSWEEPINLFAFVLAGSGSGKSPALKTLLSPIKAFQKQAESIYKVEMQEFNEQQIEKLSKKDKKLAEKFYSDDGDEIEQPKEKVFVSTGTTPEAVGMAENTVGSILYQHDEATIFLNDLIGYRQGASNTTFWNCIWGAVPQKVQRVSGTRSLEGVAASLIALGHPGKTIKKFKEISGIKDSDTEGVYARYLICTKTAEAEELPFETPQVSLKGLLENLYQNLLNDYRPLKEDGWHKYELSEEAQRHFWEVRNLTVRLQKASGDECRAIFYPKMLSNIGRIALVLHKLKAAISGQQSSYLIPLETLKQAIEIGIYYFEQSLYVYKYGEESQADREELKLHKLFNQILEAVEKSKFAKQNGYITVGKLKDAIYEFRKNKTDIKEVESKYLVPLVEAGYLSKSDKGYIRTNLKALKFKLEITPTAPTSDENATTLEPQAFQPSVKSSEVLTIGHSEELLEGGLDF